ncbi:MAG: rhomboid family intramembrane serine protease [Rikenellaceae bacterium]|nr:rhomboid family intramembrane serine protease [Rikenellaceae bacterium]
MSLTFILIGCTVLISLLCFNNRRLFNALSLKPYRVATEKEWWRVFTHGFVHGDYIHLLVNMLVFYSFGRFVEYYFGVLSAGNVIGNSSAAFLGLYFGGMAAASVYDLISRRRDPNWSSIGASGAVSAVVFTSIFFQPWGKILLMGILPIPGILFGVLYLAYTQYSARQARDRINYHAHFYGAVYGFVYPLILNPKLIYGFFEAFGF